MSGVAARAGLGLPEDCAFMCLLVHRDAHISRANVFTTKCIADGIGKAWPTRHSVTSNLECSG